MKPYNVLSIVTILLTISITIYVSLLFITNVKIYEILSKFNLEARFVYIIMILYDRYKLDTRRRNTAIYKSVL